MSLPIRNYTAAGGVVVHENKALLLEWPARREVRLPKGHIDPGETPEAAAVREVIEESGYAPLVVLADLGTMQVEFDHQGEHVVRQEQYFLMGLAPGFEKGRGEEAFKPVWAEWVQAERVLTFEAEKEWIRRAKAAANSRP
jgi:8-oxo-dGTP pyrophosphatase MutT (NUDIX family)